MFRVVRNSVCVCGGMDEEEDPPVEVTLVPGSVGSQVELDAWHVVPAETATRFYRLLSELR